MKSQSNNNFFQDTTDPFEGVVGEGGVVVGEGGGVVVGEGGVVVGEGGEPAAASSCR
jgi:hypothetical protein